MKELERRTANPRVLFLAPGVDLSSHTGDSIHTARLASLLSSQEGMVIHLVCRGLPSDYDKVYPAILHPQKPRRFVTWGAAFVESLRVIRSEKIDLIYERCEQLSLGVILSRLMRKPLVIEVNGLGYENFACGRRANKRIEGMIRFLEGLNYRRASRVVAVSESIRSILVHRFEIPSDRVVFIPNGSDASQTRIRSRELTDSIFKLDEKINLCFVGIIAECHGLHSVLKAFAKSAFLRETFRLTIVGDGPHKHELERIVHRESLNECVSFVGRVPHDVAMEHIESSDACLAPLLPNKSVFPIKILEYMSFGKPILASDVPDHRCLVDKDIGLLFEPGNVGDIISCFKHLHTNLANFTDSARKGIRLVDTMYNWSNTARSVGFIVRKTLAENHVERR